MSDMVINVDELERFIDTLRRFDAEMEDSANKITSHFATLGDAWRDQQYQNFAGTWDTAMHAIDDYVAESPRYVNYLLRKASIASEFLGR